MYLLPTIPFFLLTLLHFVVCRAVYPSAEELQFLTFESEIFYFLLLPPIIVSASFLPDSLHTTLVVVAHVSPLPYQHFF